MSTEQKPEGEWSPSFERFQAPKPGDGYFAISSSISFSLYSIVPLLVLYEVAILILHFGANPAGAPLKWPFRYFGPNGVLIFNTTVLVLAMIAWLRLRLTRVPVLNYTFFLLGESFLYGLLLGPAVLKVTGHLPLGMGDWGATAFLRDFFGSIGAGVYEEILFRLVLMTGLYFIFKGPLKLGRSFSVAAAVFLSALIFSAAHYHVFFRIGGDDFDPASFLFRFFAGVYLALIYLFRGLAPAVYAHMFYDLMISFSIQGR